MISVQVYCDVDVDDVAILQLAIVRDAVADDFVHRSAAGFGKAVIIERGRVCSGLLKIVDQVRKRRATRMFYIAFEEATPTLIVAS